MMNFERQYTQLLTGGSNSPLFTDAYKYAMAQAGAPLRQETFYLSFRKGEALYIPFDLKEIVELLRPRLANTKELGFLAANGYSMSPAMETALLGNLEVWAAPVGSWVAKGEPVITVTGPSFLVSWLEPLLIALNFPLQVATDLLAGKDTFNVTCEDEALIIEKCRQAILCQIRSRKDLLRDGIFITLCTDKYIAAVTERATLVREVLGGDIERAFEVGTRAMTCLQQHRIALKALKAVGIEKTANILLAYELYMTPVGTTGHEHQQRWLHDEDGFRAVRDMRPEPPSYLFDTYDAEGRGIPAAIRVMGEDSDRRCSVRFDSGDHEAQFLQYMGSDIQPDLFIFMDGYTVIETARMEKLCRANHIPANARIYGFGGYFICAASWMKYTRNDVAMVYKLSQSGPYPVMKFAGSKSSIPGKPCIVRQKGGGSIIAQQGEEVEGFAPIKKGQRVAWQVHSEGTLALIALCEVRRGA